MSHKEGNVPEEAPGAGDEPAAETGAGARDDRKGQADNGVERDHDPANGAETENADEQNASGASELIEKMKRTIPGGTDGMTGEHIAQHYEILSVAGIGQASTVYRARHLLINKIVAIKLLLKHNLSKPTTVMRFQREAKIASLLDHPNIVKFYEFGIHTTDQPYLILEFVEGRPLSAIVKEDGPLDERRACTLMLQVLDALAYLHGQTILHRDIKPENVMVFKDAKGQEGVKIIDFGFAGRMELEADEQSLTKTGDVFGTPRYMSPEQQLGKTVDERSDIYSLAALMYFLIIGRAPFQGDSRLVTAYQRMNAPPPSVGSVVKDEQRAKLLDRVIQRGLEVEPEKRYQSVDEFKELLSALMQQPERSQQAKLAATMIDGSAIAPPSKKRKLNPLLIPSMCMMAFVAVVVYLLTSVGHSRIAVPGLADSLPEDSSELSKMWKELDLKGQKQFNKGDYEKADQTFTKSLEVAKRIDPDCDMVKASLEELYDLALARSRTPDPTWMPAIKKIGDLEKELLFKTFDELKTILDEQTLENVQSKQANDMAEETIKRTLGCCQALLSCDEKEKCAELLAKLNKLAALYPDASRKYQSELSFFEMASTSLQGAKAVELKKQTLKKLEKEIADAVKDKAIMVAAIRSYRAARLASMTMDFEKALRYYQDAQMFFAKELGPECTECGVIQFEEAQLCAQLGMRGKAQQLALEALEIFRKPNLTASNDLQHLTRLADLYSFLGKFDMASSTMAEALDLQQRAMPKDYEGICGCLNEMVHIGIQSKKLNGLEPLCQRAIAIRKRTEPDLNAWQSLPLRYLGDIARLKGDRQLAEVYYKLALKYNLEQGLESRAVSAAEDCEELSKLNLTYGTTNGYRQAILYQKERITHLEKVYGKDAVALVPAYVELADTFMKVEKYDLAEGAVNEVERIVKNKILNPREMRRIYLLHAAVLSKLGKGTEASAYTAKAEKFSRAGVEPVFNGSNRE